MPRPFAFSPSTVTQARARQCGVCAACGSSLTDRWEEAHHVVPNQAGQPGDLADDFLRRVDNCAVLCDACHTAAHAHGRFTHGAVAPAQWYPYSHGRRGRALHARWCYQIDAEWRRIRRRNPTV